jgi:hypothetical protein
VRGSTFLIVRVSEAIILALGCDILHRLLTLEIDCLFIDNDKDNLNIDFELRVESLNSALKNDNLNLVVALLLPFIIIAFDFIQDFFHSDNISNGNDDNGCDIVDFTTASFELGVGMRCCKHRADSGQQAQKEG